MSLILQLCKRSQAGINLGCSWDWTQSCNSRAKPSYFLQPEFCHSSQKSCSFSPSILASYLSALALAPQASSAGAGSRAAFVPSSVTLRQRYAAWGPALQETNPPFLSLACGEGEEFSKSEAGFGPLIFLHIIGSRSWVEKNIL